VIRVMDDDLLRFRNSNARRAERRTAGEDLAKTVRSFFIVAIAYYLGAEIAFLVGTLSDKIFAPFWPPTSSFFARLF
jgi:hypothetical protein